MARFFPHAAVIFTSTLAACAAAPESYLVTLTTDVADADPIVVEVTRSWAPLGADHFYEVVEDGFYDDSAFFRVVPNFVVQFGIAGNPAENTKWETPIQDDPVVQSNTKGTLVYATSGANTRTTQLFINYKDNTGLDSQGFAPFGRIVSGMDTATSIFNPTPTSSNGISQTKYTAKGNDWLKANYPEANFITTATLSDVAESESKMDQIKKQMPQA